MRGGSSEEIVAVDGRKPACSAKVNRWLFRLGRAVIVAAVIVVLILFFFQGYLLWHPRTYPPGQVESFPRPLDALSFRTGEGNQTAFYAGPRDHRPFPAALWLLFAGNGSLALDWADLAAGDPDPGRAFLFVDYPGFGRCEGEPSPQSIAQNVDGALAVLAQKLGQPNTVTLLNALETRGMLGVMGHSMGAGTALAFAARTPEVSRIVLVSPFTSLRAMARLSVGWPLCWLLRGDFNNIARLDEIAHRAARPSILILHGDHDTLIPQYMGRLLAERHPDFTRFESVPGAGHDDIVAVSGARLQAALDGR